MKLCLRVTLYLLLATLIFASAAGAAPPVRDGDPGTIGACLVQPDGTLVALPCEQVIWRGVSGKSFAIKESFEKYPTTPRLVVVSRRPLPVEKFWTVDVTGVLTTLESVSDDGRATTQRALIVSPEDVTVYCSPNGRPYMFLPIKGYSMDWLNKRSLAELSGATVEAASVSIMDEGGLPPMPDSPDSPTPPPAAGSRDNLKWLPDGAPVSINGAIVSAGFSNYGFFYVERSDRMFGVWISTPDYVYDGNLVDITGKMATSSGERAVVADQGGVNVIDYNAYPRPIELGMAHKIMGGGPVGSYTPRVANGDGVNNTGLLARVFGKIKSVDEQNRVFYIDDGSGVTADDGRVGVKIYDTTYDPLPEVNTWQIVNGVCAAEIPLGSNTSIRVLWKTNPVTPSTQPGSGTISGAITAAGANGKTVRVYCASKYTKATFSGDTANYTLSVPYGDHAVTGTIRGYKTTTQLATVNAGTPSVTRNFTLPTIQRRIDIVPSPSRVLPDGASQMTITAIVRDEEGRRFGNEAITWNVDLGTVIGADSSTDAVGEARLVLQAPSAPGTANVSVTVGGMTVTGYAEFASSTAPTVRILTPTLNETVSGVITINLHASDPGGADPGIHQIALTVDGQPLSAVGTGNPNVAWTTFALPNGAHTIRAAASDGDLEYGYSPAVSVTTFNGVYNVAVDNGMFDANDPDPAKRVATISAHQDQSTNWEIEIKKNGASSPTKVFTGTGATISATWNGTDSQGNPAPRGRYKYTIRAGQAQGGMSPEGYAFSLWDYLVFMRTDPDAPTALLVEGNYFWNNNELFDIVEAACETRGFQVITIPEKYATWDRFELFMNVYEPTVLYMTTHGNYEIRNGIDCLPPRLPQVSQFKLKDSWVYAYRPTDNQGNWYPEYPEPGQPAYANIPANPENQWPGMVSHYVSELGLMYYSPLRLVWMDSCMNGRIGSLYGDLSDEFNPYAVDLYSWNDLGSEFGIYNNAWEIGASFCGYFEISMADDRYRDFLARVFGSMKVGYNLDLAITRDAWNEGAKHTALYPDGINMNYGDEAGNPCNNWRYRMPPYHNLRVHGNPWSTYLSP
ncbi:MAG: Ig-like domain-containing protein [Armatimonadota bacterium]|nr:Ig-like domain-containing protein [Armatimonadota bacterium]